MSFISPLGLLYPPKCIFCGGLLQDRGGYVCGVCAANLPSLPRGKLAVEISGVTCVAPLAYRDMIPGALKGLKFYNKTPGAAFFAPLMKSALIQMGRTDFDLVTWIPLAFTRWHRRGYNQSKLLASELAKTLGIPCRATLVKIRNTAPQSRISGADAEARRMNVKGVYRPSPFADLRGKRALIVDDVLTTGATVCACAEQLTAAGAARVTCVTAARARV